MRLSVIMCTGWTAACCSLTALSGWTLFPPYRQEDEVSAETPLRGLLWSSQMIVFVLLASIIKALNKPSHLSVQLTNLDSLILITPKLTALKRICCFSIKCPNEEDFLTLGYQNRVMPAAMLTSLGAIIINKCVGWSLTWMLIGCPRPLSSLTVCPVIIRSYGILSQNFQPSEMLCQITWYLLQWILRVQRPPCELPQSIAVFLLSYTAFFLPKWNINQNSPAGNYSAMREWYNTFVINHPAHCSWSKFKNILDRNSLARSLPRHKPTYVLK